MSADAALRFRLRAATDAAHRALHSAAPFARIADGEAALADYRTTLRMLYRYHAGMAPLCAAGAAALHFPDAARIQARRLEALTADLAVLETNTPGDVPVHPVPSDDFAVGALYVVLGSALGGKVIHRQLDYLLPGAEGRRFFAGDDGAVWRDFCRRLDAHDGDFATLCEGAAWAFAEFGRGL